jgi:hypothetical protein
MHYISFISFYDLKTPLFLVLRNIALSSTKGHFGHFHILITMNKAAIHNGMQFFVWTCF